MPLEETCGIAQREVAELGYCRCAARPFHPDDQITNKVAGPAFFLLFLFLLLFARDLRLMLGQGGLLFLCLG